MEIDVATQIADGDTRPLSFIVLDVHVPGPTLQRCGLVVDSGIAGQSVTYELVSQTVTGCWRLRRPNSAWTKEIGQPHRTCASLSREAREFTRRLRAIGVRDWPTAP